MTEHRLGKDALEAGAKALPDDHANRTEFYVVPSNTPREEAPWLSTLSG